MTGALAYLIARTLRNRAMSMARRLRQPRYAIGFVIVVAYFGFLFLGALTDLGRGVDSRPTPLHSDKVQALAPALLSLLLLSSWFGGAALGALAFTQAEVALLFPAPVTRRSLILYKVARAQLSILFNVGIIMVFWGRGASEVSPWLNALGLYTLFATLHLHRLGAALVRSGALAFGRAAIKRNWLAHLVSAVWIGLVVLVVIDMTSTPIGGEGMGAMLSRIVDSLSSPLVQTALTPFAIISAPAYARTTAEWAPAFLAGAAMLALHLWWVLRSQAAFEEAAAEQSARQHAALQSIRKRGMVEDTTVGPGRRLTLPLRAMGHPAVAILWKNSLGFIRTFRPRMLLTVLAAPIIMGVVLGAKAGDPYAAVAGVSAMLSLVLLLAGGMTARNDLREDLLNLSSLKTVPLRGHTIVLAEISSSALPLVLMQWLLLWVGLVGLQLSKHPMPGELATALFLTLPVGLAGLNLLTSTIRNGIAVLFPAWVRLGDSGSGGMEVMGQAMLSMLAMLLGLVILMVAPTLATLFIVSVLRLAPPVALASSIVIGAASVAVESYLVMLWVGRVLERTEPSAALSQA